MHSWLEVPANYRCNSVLAVARLGGQAVRLMLSPSLQWHQAGRIVSVVQFLSAHCMA